MPIPRIYTPEEARRVLHIGRNRIYELLRSGLLKSIRNGRNYLIPESCLSDFIEAELAGKAGTHHE